MNFVHIPVHLYYAPEVKKNKTNVNRTHNFGTCVQKNYAQFRDKTKIRPPLFRISMLMTSNKIDYEDVTTPYEPTSRVIRAALEVIRTEPMIIRNSREHWLLITIIIRSTTLELLVRLTFLLVNIIYIIGLNEIIKK